MKKRNESIKNFLPILILSLLLLAADFAYAKNIEYTSEQLQIQQELKADKIPLKANRLYVAIQKGDNELVEKFLKSQGLRYSDGSALNTAINAKNDKALDLLLEAGANPNSSYIGWQSLNWAICVNYVYGVKQLIKYGADINRRSLEGTPLELALQKNKMEIVEILRGENVHESVDSLTATQSIKGAALVDLSETKNISSASPSQKPVDSRVYETKKMSVPALEQFRYVAVDKLNARSTNSTSGAILEVLPKGKYVKVVSVSGDWSYIEWTASGNKKRLGWVASKYISKEYQALDIKSVTPKGTVAKSYYAPRPASLKIGRTNFDCNTDYIGSGGFSDCTLKVDVAIQVPQSNSSVIRMGSVDCVAVLDYQAVSQTYSMVRSTNIRGSSGLTSALSVFGNTVELKSGYLPIYGEKVIQAKPRNLVCEFRPY